MDNKLNYTQEELNKMSLRERRKVEEKQNAMKLAQENKQRIREILERTSPIEMYNYCKSRIIGQNDALKKCVFLVYSYLDGYANNKPIHIKNWFLTAQSGMGKTEFFRATRDFFKLKGIDFPIVQIDLSQITQTGFRGTDINDIVPNIEATSSYKQGGYGICFFDESDKKILPSYDSHGENVNARVQENILTFIEGIEIDGFDTSKTMFVFMGAFQEVRNLKKQIAVIEDGLGITDETANLDITINDMVDGGMIDEFAGRVTQVINFHRIAESNMKKLIDSKIHELEKKIGMGIHTEPEAFEQLVNLSYGRLGIREPMNKLSEIATELLAEAMFDESHEERDYYICIYSLDDYYIEYDLTDEEIDAMLTASGYYGI